MTIVDIAYSVKLSKRTVYETSNHGMRMSNVTWPLETASAAHGEHKEKNFRIAVGNLSQNSVKKHFLDIVTVDESCNTKHFDDTVTVDESCKKK